MIKAIGKGDGPPMLVLGLSIENRLRLGEGRPILIHADELTAMRRKADVGPEFAIVLVGGDTEESIAAELREHGLPGGEPA